VKRPGNTLATFQLIAAIASTATARWLAPTIDTAAKHRDFVDFFATSASVIAALLIALAIESRLVVRSKFLATLSAITVAVGLLSAVAALGPDLSVRTYRWLFALTVGGGVGALVAALVVGAQTMAAESVEARLEEIQKLYERSLEDRKRMGGGV
jgi:hypothetical protein